MLHQWNLGFQKTLNSNKQATCDYKQTKKYYRTLREKITRFRKQEDCKDEKRNEVKPENEPNEERSKLRLKKGSMVLTSYIWKTWEVG